MIRVTVELLSAISPDRNKTLAMMDICNDGMATTYNPNKGDYVGQTYIGRDRTSLERCTPSKRGGVKNWSRNAYHVWNLVAAMLKDMGYDQGQKK